MTSNDAADRLIAEAKRYLGLKEDPVNSNRGILLDAWLLEAIRDRKVALGQPWCAAFVSQMGVQALGRSRWPVPLTASTVRIGAWAKAKDVLHSRPHAGDLFLLYYPTRNRYAHVGIVAALSPAGRIATIEGNTNPGGGREGYGVFERERPVTQNTHFVRWPECLNDA